MQFLNKAPISPLRLNPVLPAQLEAIISKALEKDREMRYQNAAEMRTDLKRLKRDSESGKSATNITPAMEGSLTLQQLLPLPRKSPHKQAAYKHRENFR